MKDFRVMNYFISYMSCYELKLKISHIDDNWLTCLLDFMKTPIAYGSLGMISCAIDDNLSQLNVRVLPSQPMLAAFAVY